MNVDSGKATVRMLSESRKVIPLRFRNGEIWHTDIKLPDLLVANESASILSLAGVSLHAFANGVEVCVLRQAGDLAEPLANANARLNALAARKLGPGRTYNSFAQYAMEPEAGDVFQETPDLPPGTKARFPLSDLVPFHCASAERIDRILAAISVRAGDREDVLRFEVPLTPYECKGDYIFPLRGPVTIEGTPWSREIGHREAVSQEFAFDIIDVRRLGNGQLSDSDPARSSDVRDYFAFDREVLAIGEGIVAEAGNEWPDAFGANPNAYSQDRVLEMTKKLLADGMPFNHAILGNYVVIDHRNGEFSTYVHMREGSVSVEVGQVVKQGQAIGRVGNTGNSMGPHLHFHLMDGPDFCTANGLPIRFRDVPRTLMAGAESLMEGDQKNALLYSDYIFTHIGEA